jgi:cobalt-zinc-cadmium resistance protein CzcA
MLVDGAVVVVENVVERLSLPHKDGNAREDDLPRLNQVFRATADVIVPVSAGIVIIALVFLPLLSLQGLEGKLFAPVALTIVFALAGSLLLALTLVPVLASFGLKRGHHGEPWIMRWLTRAIAACWVGPLPASGWSMASRPLASPWPCWPMARWARRSCRRWMKAR